MSSDVLDRPEDRNAEALMLTVNKEACEPITAPTIGMITAPTIVTRKNIGKMIEYWQDDRQRVHLVVSA